MIKKIIKKIFPKRLIDYYNLLWVVLGNVRYGFPSRKLVVIGVTGTKGKSTTSNILWKILTENGHKTGMTTTANFRIGDKEWINSTKMTMQGRMRLQQLLAEMVKAGCTHAVVETSSEGIKQFRHIGIDYNAAVITNLTPEHIEAHGSFAKYKQAKGKLFKALKGKGLSITNADDEHTAYFQQFPAEKKLTFGIDHAADIQAVHIKEHEQGSSFVVDGTSLHTPLIGWFNIYNVLAATAVARGLGISWEVIAKALTDFDHVPGRMEKFVSQQAGFTVYVDYAHTAESLEAVYKAVKPHARRLIAVHGATGGGRDTAKRPVMGKISGQYADIVIVTDEDPYTENPEKIIDAVVAGVKETDTEYYKVIDRKDAIQKALELAKEGDVVTITGKGSETVMATASGMVPWSDSKIVEEYLAQ